MAKDRLLRKKDTGEVFIYTAVLAGREDMEPVVESSGKRGRPSNQKNAGHKEPDRTPSAEPDVAAESAQEGSDGSTVKPLSRMSKPELVAYARDALGSDIDGSATHGEVLTAVRLAEREFVERQR